MRADQLLVHRGLAATRSQAQRLIASGVRWRLPHGDGLPWRAVAKNGDELPDAAQVELLDTAESRYVSRGGLKLEGALRSAGLDVTGWHCLDIGQSTGGFTDCLLRHGAAHVIGVDVGHGQLHDKLRGDARVTVFEKLNARDLRAEQFGRPFDLVTGDLSFISLTLVLPALVPLLRAGVRCAHHQPTESARGNGRLAVSEANPSGHLLMLVKPQFELQPADIGKGGLVRDPALYAQVEQRVRNACAANGLQVMGWYASPISGGDGNREFFLYATH